jgi:hypothetical protein
MISDAGLGLDLKPLSTAGWRSILAGVLARVRSWFDGAGWFVGLAAALFAFALLAVLLQLQSPDLVLWSGTRVAGTEQGGIVTYRWHGQQYSINAVGYGSAKNVSVYLNPGDPSNAMIDHIATRILDAALIGAPIAGGVALLVAGGTRKYRWARRNARRAREFRL